MKKLHVVEVCYTVFVLAESEAEAVRWTDANVRKVVSDQSDPDLSAVEVHPGSPIYPPGWDEECLVYGPHEGDITVAQALKGAG